MYWNGEGLAYFLAVAPGDSPRGSLVYEQEDNILKIEDIKISASGVFQCISYNEAGMVTQYKTVIIRGKGTFSQLASSKSFFNFIF